MSHTLMTGVVLDVPPMVLARSAEGGPARTSSRALTGEVIVSEFAQNQTKGVLRLAIAFMSDAQRQALETSLDTPGPRTVYTGGESPVCIPGARSEQKIEAILGDYPDRAAGGSQELPAWQRVFRAELVFYRLS